LEAAEIYEEALQVILAGLTQKTLTYRGRHYQFRGVPMELEPVQRPHPPLWQGVTSAESATAAAKRGASVVGHGPIAGLRPIVEALLAAWDGRASGAGLVGCGRHIHVAETDAEAMKIAAPAYRAWYDSLVSLWRKFRSVPFHFEVERHRAELAPQAHQAVVPGAVGGCGDLHRLGVRLRDVDVATASDQARAGRPAVPRRQQGLD